MTVSTKKWGNSLAVRIPKDVAASLHIAQDTPMELHIVEGALVLKPLKRNRLQELVAGIRAENLHDEISTGESMGNEAW